MPFTARGITGVTEEVDELAVIHGESLDRIVIHDQFRARRVSDAGASTRVGPIPASHYRRRDLPVLDLAREGRPEY
jgi:hypothetical protein